MSGPETGLSYRSSSPYSLAFEEAVCEAVGATVPDRFDTQRTPVATVAAGADEAEAHPSEGVAAGAAVLDTDGDGADTDGVDRRSDTLDGLSGGRKPDPQLDTPTAESVRLARLSRWQEQR